VTAFGRLAVTIETRGGLNCGDCGLPHASGELTVDDMCCSCCPPCNERAVKALASYCAECFPDVIPPGCRVATRRMIQECIWRMQAEIAAMERRQDERDRPAAGPVTTDDGES